MELKELIKNYILKKSMKLNVAQNSPNQLNVMINDTMKDPIVNIRLIYKKQKVWDSRKSTIRNFMLQLFLE